MNSTAKGEAEDSVGPLFIRKSTKALVRTTATRITKIKSTIEPRLVVEIMILDSNAVFLDNHKAAKGYF